MHEMTYFTDKKIGLNEIAQVAEEIGHKPQQQGNKELFIYFSAHDNFPPEDRYCHWIIPTEGEQVINKRMRKFEKLQLNPRIALYTECKHVYLLYFVPLLRTILERYGGCIETNTSYKMFTLKDANKLLSVLHP